MVRLKIEELSLVLMVYDFYWVTSEPSNKLAPFTATPQVSIHVSGGRPIVDFPSSSRLEAKQDNLDAHGGCASSSKTSPSASSNLNHQSSPSMAHPWVPSHYNAGVPPDGFGEPLDIKVEMEVMELAMVTTSRIELITRLIFSWSDSRLLDGNMTGGVLEVPPATVWHPYVKTSWWGQSKTRLLLLKNSTLLFIHSLQLHHRCIEDISMLPNDQHSCLLTISIPNTPRSAAQLQWQGTNPPPTSLPHLLSASSHLISDNNHPGSTPQIHLQLDISRDFQSFLFLSLIPSHLVLFLGFISWVSSSSRHKITFLHLLCLLLTVWHCCLRCSLELTAPTMLDAWMAICILLMLLATLNSLHSSPSGSSRPPLPSSQRVQVLPTQRPKAGPSMYGGLQEEEDRENAQGGRMRPSCCVVGAWIVVEVVTFIIWIVVTLKWNWRKQVEDAIL